MLILFILLLIAGCGSNSDDCPPTHSPNLEWTADYQMKATCLLDKVYMGAAPNYSYANLDGNGPEGLKGQFQPDGCGVVLSHHYRTGMLPDFWDVERLPGAVAEDKRRVYLHESCHFVMEIMDIDSGEHGERHHEHWLWKHCGCY